MSETDKFVHPREAAMAASGRTTGRLAVTRTRKGTVSGRSTKRRAASGSTRWADSATHLPRLYSAAHYSKTQKSQTVNPGFLIPEIHHRSGGRAVPTALGSRTAPAAARGAGLCGGRTTLGATRSTTTASAREVARLPTLSGTRGPTTPSGSACTAASSQLAAAAVAAEPPLRSVAARGPVAAQAAALATPSGRNTGMVAARGTTEW